MTQHYIDALVNAIEALEYINAEIHREIDKPKYNYITDNDNIKLLKSVSQSAPNHVLKMTEDYRFFESELEKNKKDIEQLLELATMLEENE